MENQISGIAEEFLSPQERSRLVGFCCKLTGNPDIAEDLAQETLFLAWHRMETLRNPEKRVQWITGIARNVSLHWLRQHGRNLAQSVELPQSTVTRDALTLEERVADDFDLEVELERKELIELLERAMALLPGETRTILVKRYIEESPLAEIAGLLGTTASTVAMRLQRGKLALRKILTSDMQQEILAYQTGATAQTWERTSLWCNLCGKHRLLGKKQSDRGLLYLKCPECSPGDEVLSKNELIPLLKGIKSFKPAYARLGERRDESTDRLIRLLVIKKETRKTIVNIGLLLDATIDSCYYILAGIKSANRRDFFLLRKKKPRCPFCEGLCGKLL